MRLRRSDAVGKEEELTRGGVNEGEGISADYGGGDVGEVVRVEGGRGGARAAVRGGVVCVRAAGRGGEGAEEGSKGR